MLLNYQMKKNKIYQLAINGKYRTFSITYGHLTSEFKKVKSLSIIDLYDDVDFNYFWAIKVDNVIYVKEMNKDNVFVNSK